MDVGGGGLLYLSPKNEVNLLLVISMAFFYS